MSLDKTYLSVSDGTRDAALMHVTSNRSIGSTVLHVDTIIGVPAKFIATVGTVNASGFINPATATNFYGRLSGADLQIDGFCPGNTDVGNTSGQIVVIKPNTAWADLIAAAIEAMPGSILAAAYPIGSIYTNAVNATNPATLLGFGTWTAFATGRVLVGIDAGQAEFDTIGETGGEKTHTLSTGEMPVHSHGVTDPGHTHSSSNNIGFGAGPVDSGRGRTDGNSPNQGWLYTNSTNTTGISINNAGSGNAHNNLQPYITVYMWRRTA